MEVSERLRMVMDALHVAEVRQESPVPHHPAVITPRVLEYHLPYIYTSVIIFPCREALKK